MKHLSVTDVVGMNQAARYEFDYTFESLLETSIAVESVCTLFEKSLERGGLTKPEAQLALIAVNQIHSRLDIRGENQVSMEEITEPIDRLTDTKLALEDLKETAKKIWAWISSMLSKLYEYIKGVFSDFYNTLPRLETRVNQTREKIKAADKYQENTLFENETLFKHLNIGGKTYTSIAHAFKEALDEYGAAITLNIGEYNSKVIKVLEELAADGTPNIGYPMGELIRFVEELAPDQANHNFGFDVPEGCTLRTSKNVLVGNQMIVAFSPGSSFEDFSKTKIFLKDMTSEFNVTNTQWKTVSKSYLNELLKQISLFIDYAMKHKSQIEQSQKSITELAKKVTQFTNKPNAELNTGDIKILRGVAAVFPQVLSTFTGKCAVQGYNTCRYGLDYIDASLNTAK